MSILWYAVGYSLAFSEGTPFIGGLSKAFLSGISISTLSGSIPELLLCLLPDDICHPDSRAHHPGRSLNA